MLKHVNVNTLPDPVDLDDVAASSKTYVGDIMDTAGDILKETLPAFFGNGNLTLLSELYDQLREVDLVDDSHRATTVGKV